MTVLLQSELFVSPQNSYVEILTIKVIVLEDGTCSRWLGHDGGVLMNGISAQLKEAPERSLAPFSRWGHSVKDDLWITK